MPDISEVEEDLYLCQLFGDDGRFVEFINLTGRPVRLIGRLQMRSFSNMAWSTKIIILQGGRHVWRFLGDSANDLEDFLFFLPEPYNLARENSFKWVAEYLDSMEEAEVTFNHKDGPLRLDTLELLPPRGKCEVRLRRKDRAVSALNSLTKDAIVAKRKDLSAENISCLEFPKTLEEEVLSLKKDYADLEKVMKIMCRRCKELHL